MATWHLTDAAEIARTHKYTFSRPSNTRLNLLKVGDLVKLVFAFEGNADDPSAERMWVQVDTIGLDGQYQGRLRNQPAYITDLAYDDSVMFIADNIISILSDTPVVEDGHIDLVEKYHARCFVTRKVLYDNQPVGCIYREEPETDTDSGWRIMAGDEDQEYMNIGDNIFYVSLGAVLNMNDHFVHLLDSPVGSEYERDEETGKFVEVTG